MDSDPSQPLGPDYEQEDRPPSGNALYDPYFPGNVTPLDASIGAGFVGGFLVALVAYLKRRLSRRRYHSLDE